jgi:hypothetical protein
MLLHISTKRNIAHDLYPKQEKSTFRGGGLAACPVDQNHSTMAWVCEHLCAK